MVSDDNVPSSEQTSAQRTTPSTSTDLEYVVRFGAMRALGVMTSRRRFAYDDQVVARTPRGTELATVLCEATADATAQVAEPSHGRIIRLATAEDLAQAAQLDKLSGDDLTRCQKYVDSHRLEMELVDAERVLGGEKLVVYFLAEQRVDFRQLVRDLAREFQTRIEMRQIGVRDEAKLLADYGDCGRPICCANHLTKMPPVSMKMAKLQKATLDPNKISGRCGRLKCCLRYEFDHYEEASQEMPPVGSRIVTRDGAALVLAQDVLSGQLKIETEEGRRILIGGHDVVSITERGGGDVSPEKSRRRKRSRRPN